jgi:hypothetical protein
MKGGPFLFRTGATAFGLFQVSNSTLAGQVALP